MKNGHILTPIAREEGAEPRETWKWCIRCGALVLGEQVFHPGARQRKCIDAQEGVQADKDVCVAREAGFSLQELGSIYARLKQRFLVTFVASYSPRQDGVKTPLEAANAALNLTRDDGSEDTQWYVFDRTHGRGEFLRQRRFDEELLSLMGPAIEDASDEK